MTNADAGIKETRLPAGIGDAGPDSEGVRLPQRDSGVANNRCTVADLVYLTELKDSDGACTDSCDSDSIDSMVKCIIPVATPLNLPRIIHALFPTGCGRKTARLIRRHVAYRPCGQAITTHRSEGGDTKDNCVKYRI